MAVEAVVLDDTEGSAGGARWSPAKAAANARAATQDSTAIAYLGDFESGATRASLPITNEAPMLQVSPASGGRRPGGAVPGLRRGAGDAAERRAQLRAGDPGDDAQAEAAAGWARELGWRRIAIAEDGSAFGETLAQAFTDEARDLGLAVGRGDSRTTYLAGDPAVPPGAVIGSDAFLSPYGDRPRLRSAGRPPPRSTRRSCRPPDRTSPGASRPSTAGAWPLRRLWLRGDGGDPRLDRARLRPGRPRRGHRRVLRHRRARLGARQLLDRRARRHDPRPDDRLRARGARARAVAELELER